MFGREGGEVVPFDFFPDNTFWIILISQVNKSPGMNHILFSMCYLIILCVSD